jgi:hypothetical protein
VHAQRLERDLAHDDKLVVALLIGKRRQVERLRRQQLGERHRHPTCRVADPVGVRVGAERDEQIARRAFSRDAINRPARTGHWR